MKTVKTAHSGALKSHYREQGSFTVSTQNFHRLLPDYILDTLGKQGLKTIH